MSNLRPQFIHRLREVIQLAHKRHPKLRIAEILDQSLRMQAESAGFTDYTLANYEDKDLIDAIEAFAKTEPKE